MNVGSLFSGIGGLDAGLARAGFRHAFMCESDPWRRDILAARFPGVPIYEDVGAVAVQDAGGRSLHRASGPPESDTGDDRRNGRGKASSLDLLCGGFPCQDVSVAGRRAGLAGARSGLFHEFARVASVLMPKWLLIENVPGLLSSNDGADFIAILDEVQKLGYVPEVNIVDSQHYGVPQRRRRVFFLCVHVEHGRQARTPISLPMLVQALTEISAFILIAENARSITAPGSWASGYESCVDGLRRRMTLFGATSEKAWMRLLDDFLVSLRRSPSELASWVSLSESARFGDDGKTDTSSSAPTRTVSVSVDSSTESLLRKAWADLFLPASAFITSTSTSPTTSRATSLCAEIVASISECIAPLIASFPLCWNEDSSGSTARKVLTSYARQSSSSLFGDLDGVREWEPAALRAERVQGELERDPRAAAERCGEVLAVGTRCQRHPATRAEARQDVAVASLSGLGSGGPDDNDGQGGRLVDRRREDDENLVSYNWQSGGDVRLSVRPTTEHVDALSKSQVPAVGVRRLTPVECERLQALPDNWTATGSEPDSRRYAALGDAVTASVGEWLGRRIAAA